ncbi:protein yippee-like 3 isoform X1 [Monodelphis domestica]|uniref:protein yippee-like 3 isoform X1 n=1 Tax=Monodelphis domestica TaxID=13616 RepID=UPI0024E20874|nr:protein yippee-like 3 isoform X1 [Monodelphis domestica]
MVRISKPKTFQAYLDDCHRRYSCAHCRAHLANHDDLISKSFQGSQGRAYLFNSVVNVGCGPAEERVLLTGLHAVADIHCESCKTTLGWKYVSVTCSPPIVSKRKVRPQVLWKVLGLEFEDLGSNSASNRNLGHHFPTGGLSLLTYKMRLKLDHL